jgi:hypothetical protein
MTYLTIINLSYEGGSEKERLDRVTVPKLGTHNDSAEKTVRTFEYVGWCKIAISLTDCFSHRFN